MKKVLVAEDEQAIREFVVINLKRAGYEPYEASNGEEALEIYEREGKDFDVAILDIMMPGKYDGLAVCKELRKQSGSIGIIMLTARTQEMDKVSGLMMGADDYVTKPFTPMELMARVNSQLRRYRKFLEKLTPKDNVHVIGGLEINEEAVEVTMDGNPVKLTPIEYKILLLLAKNPGRVFSAEEIYERVWQEKAINTDTIMVHVRNIREKIEIDTKNPKYLKVVWGVGYKIEKQP